MNPSAELPAHATSGPRANRHPGHRPGGTTPVNSQVRGTTRRTWLGQAVQGLAPLLFVGCGSGLASRSGPLRVGLLHSQTGPLALSESPLRDAELFAIDEINARGGLLGRSVEAVAPDTKSRSDDLYAKRARKLLIEEQVPVVFGGYTSTSRRAILPLFEENSRLLVFPAQTEGNLASPNLVCGGALPNQQVLPALEWLLQRSGGPGRLVFVGSEGLYSRTVHHIAQRWLATRQLAFAGQAFVPLQGADWGPTEALLAADNGPVSVLATLVGDSTSAFSLRLREMPGVAGRVTVLGLRLGEDELRLLPPEVTQGQFAGATYFQSLDTPANRSFLRRFRFGFEKTGEPDADDEEVNDLLLQRRRILGFGYDRVTSDAMESAYSLVHLWALAVEKARAVDLASVRQALRDVSFAGPGGEWKIDPATQHTTKTFHVGRVNARRQFEIVYSSPQPIPPEVFPQFAFPGWGCDLTAGGVTAGDPVPIETGESPPGSEAGRSAATSSGDKSSSGKSSGGSPDTAP